MDDAVVVAVVVGSSPAAAEAVVDGEREATERRLGWRRGTRPMIPQSLSSLFEDDELWNP